MTTKANKRPQTERSEPPLARLLLSTPTGKWEFLCATSDNSFVQGVSTEMAEIHDSTFVRKRQKQRLQFCA
jgi:hypothetical protein